MKEELKNRLEELGVNLPSIEDCTVDREGILTCKTTEGVIVELNEEKFKTLSKYEIGESVHLFDLPESSQEIFHYLPDEAPMETTLGMLVSELGMSRKEVESLREIGEIGESDFGEYTVPDTTTEDFVLEDEKSKTAYYARSSELGTDIYKLYPKEELKGKFIIEWSPMFSNIGSIDELDKYFKVAKVVDTREEAEKFLLEERKAHKALGNLYAGALTWYRLKER